MNCPAASCGAVKSHSGLFFELVTPECFNRGSTALTTTLSHVEWVGGPVWTFLPGFQPKDGSVRSHVADPLKACGNDGVGKDKNLPSKLLEANPFKLNRRQDAPRGGGGRNSTQQSAL
jgi:hypothetical protein